MKIVHTLSALTFTMLWLPISVAAAALFHLTDLGPLPGHQFSMSQDIGAINQVAGGSSQVEPGGPFGMLLTNTRAVLWSNGSIQNLGLPAHGDNFSMARAMNAVGQVVGESSVITDGTFGVVKSARAFLWTSAGGMQDLGALRAEDNYVMAYGINNSGQVIGDSYGSTGRTDGAFIWSVPTGMQRLGTLPGFDSSFATGISNTGVVVGSCDKPSGNGFGISHAFAWTSANGMQDLGDLLGGMDSSQATSVNDFGRVVGSSNVGDGTYRAFLWSESTGMQPLGALPGSESSDALSINNSGVVVGTYGQNAAIWDSSGTLADLNSLVDESGAGWMLTTANAVDDFGYIAGYGITPDGNTHTFLLTPVPEPEGIALFAIGFVGVGLAVAYQAIWEWVGPKLALAALQA